MTDDEELGWLLFVDGCAILQYIYCAANDKFEELKIKTDNVAFGQQDLFLLENQLPYHLLKWLMSWSENEDELKNSIENTFKGSFSYQRISTQCAAEIGYQVFSGKDQSSNNKQKGRKKKAMTQTRSHKNQN